MGEMASALAHELNQPLSAIANYMMGSRRLLEGQTDDTARMVRDAMDKAAEQALRAGQIIRRLRDFVARGESDKRVESLKKLVEEAGALALVGVKEHGVRVTLPARSVDRPGDRRPGADPAGDPQPDPQRDRGHGGVAAARAVDLHRACRRRHGGGQRHRHGTGHRAGSPAEAVRALHHHQEHRHGRGPVDLAHHHRGAWRRDLGGAERRRRHGVPLHAAHGSRRRELSMSTEPMVHIIDDDPGRARLAGIPAAEHAHPCDRARVGRVVSRRPVRPNSRVASSPTSACRRSPASSWCGGSRS